MPPGKRLYHPPGASLNHPLEQRHVIVAPLVAVALLPFVGPVQVYGVGVGGNGPLLPCLSQRSEIGDEYDERALRRKDTVAFLEHLIALVTAEMLKDMVQDRAFDGAVLIR